VAPATDAVVPISHPAAGTRTIDQGLPKTRQEIDSRVLVVAPGD